MFSNNRRVRMIMKPLFPRMSNKECRLQSFENWSKKNINIESLADSGFYYIGNGENDAIRCFWCCGHFEDLKIGDIPNKRHRETYPECKFAEYDIKKELQNHTLLTHTASTGNVSENKPLDYSESTCKICFKEEKQVFFMSCGHLYCCISCSKNIKTCGVCRKPITKRKRIYLS